ncbi:DUF2244 domain-containing protein [Paracoccaceae bacterium Fryx2]|nr:DUF2244 domain-containing protein [Paracoccaceae bacterium Fryx2]
MPYEWVTRLERAPGDPGAFSHAAGDGPACRLHLWPYRSLPRRGFVWCIGLLAALLALPLLAVLGTPVLWGLLPFLCLAVAGMWWALTRSYRDAEIVEELALWSDHVTLTRHGPRGRRQDWQANPHWVRVMLHASGGPVPNYLTLAGGVREVELGTFLSEPERVTLAGDLAAALAGIRRR